ASKLTRSPARALPSVVRRCVSGITATSNARPRRSATVRLTPSSATDPFSTTNRDWPGGIVKRYVQELPALSILRRCATPSTCPRTKCPESRSPQRRARSRFTRSPGRRTSRLDRRRVSPERSARSLREELIAAVRQTPETQTLSPAATRPQPAGSGPVRRAPPPRGAHHPTAPLPGPTALQTPRAPPP